MIKNRQETIADIVAWLRRPREGENAYLTLWREEIADRIEASEKQSVTNYNHLGNAAAHKCECDKYKDHINELNRQILVMKREKKMSDTYFCGYDPEEALVAQCSTCRFFQKKYSHCELHDSLTNAKYKCSGWKFKTNKECEDEFLALLNHELLEIRAENDLLRAALKPVLECRVLSSMTAEVGPGRGEYCATIIEKAQHIYNEGKANQKKGGVK